MNRSSQGLFEASCAPSYRVMPGVPLTATEYASFEMISVTWDFDSSDNMVECSGGGFPRCGDSLVVVNQHNKPDVLKAPAVAVYRTNLDNGRFVEWCLFRVRGMGIGRRPGRARARPIDSIAAIIRSMR